MFYMRCGVEMNVECVGLSDVRKGARRESCSDDVQSCMIQGRINALLIFRGVTVVVRAVCGVYKEMGGLFSIVG